MQDQRENEDREGFMFHTAQNAQPELASGAISGGHEPTKLRWGVLSTADIGVKKVIPAMQRGQYTSVVAIASRDLAKAREAAAALGIPRAYGSYEELIADPNIDAIYNPLPNQLHVPWTIKAAKAGEAAAALGIPRAYGSYEELIADPNIDAIYNPLPNQLHVPWTIKAAEAGKHV